MKNIAKNFDEFVEKVEAAERTVLNSEAGQEITKKYLELCLRENPKMTAEEWKAKKSGLMTAIFCTFCLENEDAKRELAEHVYNELRKEPEEN